ncbi:MAG: hypothetical protein COT88_00975 [Candidatus Colwellbacteria bacterium CG10_big_fil_rev_8_21_14_0_10_41_28]|uniref:Uncharacterized protein n=1 Tax=Candidatus Colwellbacteria bacterium CG10_big_fil_rev_8_21_14_0_10_41_28 TaxID=1974539 RepID=A0A2H0VHI1_9BACT|nr:MAG: hypothetical protein COT88_00975 [Candidatus Colwellbacteria bacterium CG10_big_fil_rev_8_21_14_0_10_41_28]
MGLNDLSPELRDRRLHDTNLIPRTPRRQGASEGHPLLPRETCSHRQNFSLIEKIWLGPKRELRMKSADRSLAILDPALLRNREGNNDAASPERVAPPPVVETGPLLLLDQKIDGSLGHGGNPLGKAIKPVELLILRSQWNEDEIWHWLAKHR